MKKRTPLIAFALILAGAVLFSVSCSSDGGSSNEGEKTYCTVSFSTEHGTAPSSISVESGKTLTSSQLPSSISDAYGYALEGWYDGETQVSAESYVVSKNVTLIAKFSLIDYGISYVQNKGEWASGYTAPSVYTVESETIVLPTGTDITLSENTFKGWFESPDFSGSAVTQLKTGSYGDKTYYAKWAKTVYSISYSGSDNATLSNGVQLYTGFTEEDTEITLPVADEISKSGYTFGGWYSDSSFTSPVTSLTKDSATSGSTLTLYAKWTVDTYTISYTENGGSWEESYTAPSSYTVESESITLAASSDISKTGYTFSGWYAASDFSGEAVTEIACGSYGDVTLYAKWTAIEYTITYENCDGATNSNATSYTVESSAITLKNASKTGYTFSGWYSDSDFSTKVSEIASGSTGNVTLYAKLIPYTKEITYFPNYYDSYSSGTSEDKNPAYSEINFIGENSSGIKYYDQVILFGEQTSLTPVNFYADGWIFTGWNTKKDGSGTSYSDEQIVLWNAAADSSMDSTVSQITESFPSNNSGYSLYAQWTKKDALIYTITLPAASAATDLVMSQSGSKLTAYKSGFSGNFYWYVDGSSSATFSESVTTSGGYSYFDCKTYLGKESTDYGVHTVMVKITDSSKVYTQTAVVVVAPYEEE